MIFNYNWPVIAICYDFDKTLSPSDMQEYTLFNTLQVDSSEFWEESNRYAVINKMDKILSYMKLIVDKASDKKIPITQKLFNEMGANVELYDGVEEWFDRINEFCYKNEINVEHYIISAGLKEILDGTSIVKKNYFKYIYASEFVYNEYNKPVWPRQVVNYTTKTQYLFRISKNCLDLSDDDGVNNYIAEESRRIPLRNMIYIGDSDTDIPAMKLVKQGGGHSLGVYNPELVDVEKTARLIGQNRIDYFVPADYRENSRLDLIVKRIILDAKFDNLLKKYNETQKSVVDELDFAKGYIKYLESQSYNSAEEIKFAISQCGFFYQKQRASIKRVNKDVLTNDEINKLFYEFERKAISILELKLKDFVGGY